MTTSHGPLASASPVRKRPAVSSALSVATVSAGIVIGQSPALAAATACA